MPEPLTPPDCDLRDFAYMPLDASRLLDSDMFALSMGDEFKAGLALWCKAWQQVPAGSLPNDDRVLAHLSGAGSRWKKLKAGALRGFILCSDGRLYHPVVCEKALKSWGKKQSYRERSKKGNKKRWGSQKDKSQQSDSDPLGTAEAILEPPKGSISIRDIPLDKESNGAADPEKAMFDSGIVLLAKAGVGETKARTLIGKWKREHGSGTVIEAMGKAQREGAIEPVAFIEGCLKTHRRNASSDELPIC